MRFMGSAMRMPHVQGGFRENVTVDASQALPIAVWKIHLRYQGEQHAFLISGSQVRALAHLPKQVKGQRGASFETTELRRLFKQSFLGSDMPEGQY
jgi:threonine dehydrogenase-like Zn-dependent dehydrogenase